nr:hypothetical protein [Sciscionella marina]
MTAPDRMPPERAQAILHRHLDTLLTVRTVCNANDSVTDRMETSRSTACTPRNCVYLAGKPCGCTALFMRDMIQIHKIRDSVEFLTCVDAPVTVLLMREWPRRSWTTLRSTPATNTRESRGVGRADRAARASRGTIARREPHRLARAVNRRTPGTRRGFG